MKTKTGEIARRHRSGKSFSAPLFRISFFLNPYLCFNLLLLLPGCSRLPVVQDLSGTNYLLVNQDSSSVTFPSDYRGKIVVMSFIYTHCPDVCPLTTNNMQHLQDTLAKDGIEGVRFVSLTFDPNRDTPAVLREYAGIRGIKFDDWDFLTGSRGTIDSLTYSMGVRYFPGDTTYMSDGGITYFITHTDKCVLIDRDSRVRAGYSGSRLDIAQIVKDIKSIE